MLLSYQFLLPPRMYLSSAPLVPNFSTDGHQIGGNIFSANCRFWWRRNDLITFNIFYWNTIHNWSFYLIFKMCWWIASDGWYVGPADRIWPILGYPNHRSHSTDSVDIMKGNSSKKSKKSLKKCTIKRTPSSTPRTSMNIGSSSSTVLGEMLSTTTVEPSFAGINGPSSISQVNGLNSINHVFISY